MESLQRLVSLFPQESPNTLVCTSWAMRGVDHIEEAQKLLNQMESTLARLRVESIEYGIMCALGFYPLSFEVAMLRGDMETAVRAAKWFEDNEYFSQAGILWLRLNDSRADACFARAPDLRFDRFWGRITRLHITPEIDQHHSILELENRLGYTKQSRFELANRASRLSHRSHIQCDPRAYSPGAGDGS